MSGLFCSLVYFGGVLAVLREKRPLWQAIGWPIELGGQAALWALRNLKATQ